MHWPFRYLNILLLIELLLLFSNELPLCVTITLIIIAQLLITVQRLQSNLKQTEYEKISIMKYDYIYIYICTYICVCARARAHTHKSSSHLPCFTYLYNFTSSLYYLFKLRLQVVIDDYDGSIWLYAYLVYYTTERMRTYVNVNENSWHSL